LATPSSSSSLNPALTIGPPEKSKIDIFKVSGSLTNAIFFISAKSTPGAKSPNRTLLLRIYGPSSGSLISRPAELRILHVLSSEYHIGPRVYGTFANGRVEEYFDSEALHHEDPHNPEISRWIAIRMAELHRVDVQHVCDPVEWADPGDGTRGELSVKRNVRNWTEPALEVIKLLGDCEWTREVDFERFAEEWAAYYKWVRDWEKEGNKEKESLRVFCHNDTQYGNLLKLKQKPHGRPDHHQVPTSSSFLILS
jgi:choline kinase